jgi:outer membrane protein OmpA-like peptidoglycan-associated protein
MKKTIALLFTAAALVLTGCATENKNTTKGAGIGALAGAAVGAIIGHQTGNRAQGAAAGALLGAGIGGYAGHRMDQQAKELEKIAETKRTEQGLVTKLKSDILFETGKADLKPAAKTNLKEMATIMKKYPENVLAVKGYTDATGSDRTNQTLSQKRAEAVKKELTANGLPTTTITTAGLGPASPIGSNSTVDGRKQNRRVEIEVTVDESKVPAEKK